MRRRGCRVVFLVASCAAALSACDRAPTRPEVTGQTRAITIDAVVAAEGTVSVSAEFSFAGSAGAVSLRSPVLAEISHVRIDGNPRTLTVTQYPAELPVRSRGATISYELTGGVERFSDVAVLTLPIWAVPGDASSADPPIEVRGRVTLPAPAVEEGVYVDGGLDVHAVAVESAVEFAGRVAWPRDADLVVAFPSESVPALAVLPGGPRAERVQEGRVAEADSEAAFASEIDDRRRREDLLAAGYWVLVGAEVGVPFLIAAPRLFRVAARRRRAVKGVPRELMDPPGTQSPGVVALLAHDGHDIGFEAAAATVLDLANRGVVTLDGVTSDRYEVVVAPDASGAGPGEEALLAALRQATPSDGPLSGPPLRLDPEGAWWSALRRDTLRRARADDLVERRYPSGAFLTAVVLLTATTLPLWARSPEAAVGGLVMAGILCMLPFIGGYVLTAAGHRVRAEWEAFGRRAAEASEIETAPPRAVAIWGPYLAYGAALGVAKAAIADLRPMEASP